MKSGISFERNAYNYQTETKRLVKIIYWYEDRFLKKSRNDFEKNWFKLKNDAVFGITHWDIKLVTTEKKLFGVRTKLSYCKDFYRQSISNRNEKMQILINKPVYLGLSMQIITVWILVWLYFIVCIKTDDIYKDIAEDVETRFDTSN